MALSHRFQNALLSGSLILGVGLGTAGIAAAASGSSTTVSDPSTATSAPCPHGPGDPATMAHGPYETSLSGSDQAKATAAAQAAVAGATVLRAEAGPSGTYEVHMKKSDSSYVTVILNSNFVETSIEPGFGPRPHGPGPMGPRGNRPTDAPMGPGPMGPIGPMTR